MNHVTLAVFLDLQWTFEKEVRAILLKKLKAMGIEVVALQSLADYLDKDQKSLRQCLINAL